MKTEPHWLKTKVHQFLKWSNTDKAVVYSLYSKLWFVFAGPINLILVATKFSPDIQGFYYTFLSLMSLLAFFELGLNHVITQFSSHEWAHLELDDQREIIPKDKKAFARLICLGRFAFKWYAAICLLFLVIVGFAGFWFISQMELKSFISWEMQWVTYIILSAINLYLLPFKMILLGCQQIKPVKLTQLIQAICHSLSIWLVILLDGMLWAIVLSVAVGILVDLGLIFGRYSKFFKTFFSLKPPSNFSWRLEIFPMQWRLAITSISSYFMLYLYTPIMFHHHGPVAAGQMGMTWQILTFLGGLALPWITTHSPKFGMLVAKKRFSELDQLFFRTSAMAMGVTILGGIGIWLLVYGLNYFESSLAQRLLSIRTVGIFLLAALLANISECIFIYLRAHKQEPAMAVYAAASIINLILVWEMGEQSGPVGAAAAYLLVTGGILLPFGVALWLKFRSDYHFFDISLKNNNPPLKDFSGNHKNLSVVMSNNNQAHLLPHSLKAIVEQSFAPKEVFIIDDASTDNSIDVIQSLVDEYPSITLIRSDQHQGHASSIKKGLDHVTGNYIYVTRAEYILLPHAFEKSIKLLEQYPQAGLCFGISIVEDGKIRYESPRPPYIVGTPSFLPPEKVLDAYIKKDWLITSGTTILRKEAVKEVIAFPLVFKDFFIEFSTILVSLKHGACFIPEPMSIENTEPNSFISKLNMSSEARSEYAKYRKKAEHLMNTDYANWFPPEYIEHFKNSSIYLEAYTLLSNLDRKQKQYLKNFEINLSPSTTTGRLLIFGIEHSVKLQRSILKLYLYYRLNRLSWFRCFRMFYSLAVRYFPRKPVRYSEDLNFILNKTNNDETQKHL